MKRFTSDILIFSLNSQRRRVEGFEESGKQTNQKSTEAQGVQMYSKAPPSHSQELITLILDSFYLLLPSEELSKTQYLFSHTCLQFWQTTSKILFVSYSLHVVFQLSSLASIPILIFLGMLPCNLLYKLHTKSEKKRVQKSNWVLTMWLLGNQILSFHCEFAELPRDWKQKHFSNKHMQNCEPLRYSGIIPARALSFATKTFYMYICGAADCLLIWFEFRFRTGFLGSSNSAYLPVSFISILLFMMPQQRNGPMVSHSHFCLIEIHI